jgi:hypothetical protein
MQRLIWRIDFRIVTLVRRGGEESVKRDSLPSRAAVQNDGESTAITLSEHFFC